ncbi:MAG: alkaline phosphatase [Deltaproteobacteria bacterium]|nr:alkaline phosphatase [Deltaproteobacteria bacterium]
MGRRVYRRWAFALITAVVCVSFGGAAAAVERAKNVIVLIADGCSSEQYTFARWFKGAPLSFDPIRVGAIRTFIADSVVADSAPAASAFATGVRTSDKFISVGPRAETISGVPTPEPELRHRPLATVLEGARLMGKATGIVATSRVTHATPAAYMAHVHDRGMEDDIMEQAIYQGVDVVFGGGKRHLVPEESRGRRADGEDLTVELKSLGYRIVEDRDAMMDVREGRVFGLFAHSHMDAEIDRPHLHPGQPTLAEMTTKAIELLSRDPQGFFLMVEGSQIDWACHANDPAHLLSDLLAFEEAVKAALDFARKDGRTLVLAISDHNTGGFSIGNDRSSRTYSQLKPHHLIEPFKKMSASAGALWSRMGEERTAGKLKGVVKEGWGLDITEEDALRVLALAEHYKKEKLEEYYALGRVICSRYTYVGWATHGHSGGDVPLHAFGPGRPTGVVDGPEVGSLCARAMGLDLERLNRRLFVEAGRAFGDANVRVDKFDLANPVVLITYRGKTAELPVNKHWLIHDGRAQRMEGVVVYAAKKERAYIPLQAVNIIKGSRSALPSVVSHKYLKIF